MPIVILQNARVLIPTASGPSAAEKLSNIMVSAELSEAMDAETWPCLQPLPSVSTVMLETETVPAAGRVGSAAGIAVTVETNTAMNSSSIGFNILKATMGVRLICGSVYYAYIAPNCNMEPLSRDTIRASVLVASPACQIPDPWGMRLTSLILRTSLFIDISREVGR